MKKTLTQANYWRKNPVFQLFYHVFLRLYILQTVQIICANIKQELDAFGPGGRLAYNQIYLKSVLWETSTLFYRMLVILLSQVPEAGYPELLHKILRVDGSQSPHENDQKIRPITQNHFFCIFFQLFLRKVYLLFLDATPKQNQKSKKKLI